MFLSAEFSPEGAALGVGFVIIAILVVVVFQTIDFLLTMFVYNKVAPRGSAILRIVVTAAIFFAINIICNYIASQLGNGQEQVFTSGTVISSFLDAVLGVIIAKFCTERFRGSMLAKSFKGAVLYIIISFVIFGILVLIFGGALAGGFLPAAMRAQAA